MDGIFLRFYVREDQRHHHHQAWEWLLQEANKMGIQGGSAFKSMAGFGRHHKMHEAHFFELIGLGVEVEFVVTTEEADKLLAFLSQEKLRLFYSTSPVHFGVINPDLKDHPPGSVST
jgi:PII-like signaling protein